MISAATLQESCRHFLFSALLAISVPAAKEQEFNESMVRLYLEKDTINTDSNSD
jgi:hypothetical protein